jgi:hypothetical protein
VDIFIAREMTESPNTDDEVTDDTSTQAIHYLRIENSLLEHYLKEKGIELPEMVPGSSYEGTAINTPVEVKLQLKLAIESLSKMNNLLDVRREAANKLISTIKVMLTEVDLRIGDIQRDAHNFKRDVVDSERCIHNTDRYQAEKLVRYFDQKIYDQESTLDKLKLLNNTFVNKKRRLEAQLNQKEDVSFHFIDYNEVSYPVALLKMDLSPSPHQSHCHLSRSFKMQIKQKQNKKLLTDKSAAVALRKIAAEKAKQLIVSLQSELEVLKSKALSDENKLEVRTNYSRRLDVLIKAKQEEVKIQKSELKDKQVQNPDQTQGGPDIIKAKLEEVKIQKSSDQTQGGPDVMQYILRKAEIYELQECIKTMERKIDIARGNLRNSRCRAIQANTSFHWQPGMI